MRWEDTPYVKLYRDNGPWMDLSLEARGLFAELLKVVDRAGILRLGADPVRTVARAVNGEPARVREYLDELIKDGCVDLRTGVLVLRNYVEAQGARASDRLRQAEARERARLDALNTPKTGGGAQHTETIDPMSRVSHTASHGVTHESRSEENRLEENRLEEIQKSNAKPLLLVCSEPSVEFDLEAVYRHYPLKKAKADGLKALAKAIRSRADYAAVMAGVIRFAAYEAAYTADPWVEPFHSAPPHFSTWVNGRRWEDSYDIPVNPKRTQTRGQAPVAKFTADDAKEAF